MYTLEEKIKIIEQSNSFAELNANVLPKAYNEDYYFVSYSHKDYKTVMKDILLLEDKGINIWYDSDMHIGENWENIAETYISKYQCKGIIFYLSQNSILSKACNKEVDYVLENGKQFFSINLPLEGENEICSGSAMLLKLKNAGYQVSEMLTQNFEKAFSDKCLFLPISDSIQRKQEQILKLVGENPFVFTHEYNPDDSYWSTYGYSSKLSECKDNSFIKVELKTNYEVNDVNDKRFGEMLPLKFIDKCVFANLFKLNEVVLPQRIYLIDSFAFANCYKLKQINLNGGELYKVSDYAFMKCKSLSIEEINCTVIGKFAFSDCISLKNLQLNCDKIDVFGFGGCDSLEKVTFKKPLNFLGANAFYRCKNLRQIGQEGGNENEILAKKQELIIERSVFSSCENLRQISFTGKINLNNATDLFSSCQNLTKVTFNLTKKLRKLPNNFFYLCHKLSEVSGLNGVKVYGENAFYQCYELQNINLESATEIGKKAFAECSLSEVYLPNVKMIEENAFAYNTNLTKVVIGESLKEIKSEAFYHVENLKELEIYSPNFKFSWGTFFYTSPEVLTLCNLDFLVDLFDHNCDKLKILYMKKDAVTLEKLNGYEYFVFKKEESDKEGFDKFTVVMKNKYGYYVNNVVIVTFANGNQDLIYCSHAGYDSEVGEFYIITDSGEKYYERDISNISKTYSL